jgi:hypothetical protein
MAGFPKPPASNGRLDLATFEIDVGEDVIIQCLGLCDFAPDPDFLFDMGDKASQHFP